MEPVVKFRRASFGDGQSPELPPQSLRSAETHAGLGPIAIAVYCIVWVFMSRHRSARVRSCLLTFQRVRGNGLGASPGGTWIVVEMHSDARSPGGKHAVDLHLWAAAIDRALGRFHDPVYTRQALVAQIDAFRLARQRTVEWQDEEDAKKNAEATVEVIQQALERAEGKEAYDSLADRASALIERIRQHGLGSQPFLLAIGTPTTTA